MTSEEREAKIAELRAKFVKSIDDALNPKKVADGGTSPKQTRQKKAQTTK